MATPPSPPPRRGAVRVNPVTGRMEPAPVAAPRPPGAPAAPHRDGCMLVSERYINAARDLGLGGREGEWGRAMRGGNARALSSGRRPGVVVLLLPTLIH